MENLARTTLLAYAILMGAGGVIGYVKAHSVPSLISGAGGAALIVAARVLAGSNPRAGFALGGITALILAGALFGRWQKTGHFMPSGALCIVSVIALLVAVAGLVKSPR